MNSKTYDLRLTVIVNRGGQTQVEYRITIMANAPRINIVIISDTEVVSGERVWIDWQVTSNAEIKQVRLHRVDAGEQVPLDVLSDWNGSFVSAYNQEQTQNVEYALSAEDLDGLFRRSRRLAI